MKKIYKNTLKIFLSIFFITLMTGCEDDNTPEALFEGSATERKEEAIIELRNLLQSSEQGWKVTYFTDDSQLGGFSFLFDFKDDQNVDMVSDFVGDYEIAESEYVIGYGAAVKLTFSTKNFIHDLSDSANSPTADLLGQGYRGDFEFLFYGVDEDGNLSFKTNKFFSDVIFEEATADDWVNFSELETTKENIQNDPTKSVFRSLNVGEESFNFVYNAATRFVNSDYGGFGIGFSETGIIVSPGIEVDGEEITTMDYDPTTGDFIHFDDNGDELVSITYSDTPSSPLTDYEDLGSFIDMNYFFGLDPILDSQAFIEHFDGVLSDAVANFGLEISRIVVFDLDSDVGDLAIVTNFGNFFYSFNKSIVDNKMVLTNTTPASGNDAVFAPILDLFFDPLGLYVTREGTLDGYSNTTFSFVTASNTTYKYSFCAR